MTPFIDRRSAPDWHSAGNEAAARLPATERRASLAAFLAESASLAPLLILQTLRRLDFCDAAGWQLLPRCRALRIDPGCDALVAHWHRQLHEEGLLDCDGDRWWIADSAPDEMQLDQRIDDGRHRLRQLSSWLDEGAERIAALFSQHESIDDWLRAPSLARRCAETGGLYPLWHLPGIVSDYFSALAASVLPGDGAGLLAIGEPCGLAENGPQACWTRVDARYPLASQLAANAVHDGALACDLLQRTDGPQRLNELSRWLRPGALLVVLETTADLPLHWAVPAALRTLADENPHPRPGTAGCATRCEQVLAQGGLDILHSWPQAGDGMAFCGQRLFVARFRPAQ